MNRRAPACYRRAPACCCTLAVLLAAALPAVAAVNITHRCNNTLFQYVEDHPIGSAAWHYDIPPEYIPGGTSPSNAVTRLTADTRLAFTGAFDAYFRRLLASVAFGTTQCTNILAGTEPLRLSTAADWGDDHTVTNIFLGKTNGWYTAAGRNYAATNVTVVVSNWVGYVTNIVYSPSGRPVRIKLENRYEVYTTNVLDTTRIVDRFRRDHNFMRVKDINPIGNMITSTGTDPLGVPIPAPWPQRRNLTIGTPVVGDGSLTPGDFLGWTFFALAEPSFSHSSGDWFETLYDLFAELCRGGAQFYTTSWDLFGADNSRQAIMRELMDDAERKYISFDSICPDDWQGFVNFHAGSALVGGYSAMTNLVDAYLPPAAAPAFRPSYPLTNSTRIGWAEWAGSDAYLALCDTSLAGTAALPRLRYDVAGTSGVARATYHGKAGSAPLVIYTYPVDAGELSFHRIYEITNATFELVREGDVELDDGSGAIHDCDQRIELVEFTTADGISYKVALTAHPDYSKPDWNYLDEERNNLFYWFDVYLTTLGVDPVDGDILTIGSYDGDVFSPPSFYVAGEKGAVQNVRTYNGSYYIFINPTNVICEVSVPVASATTSGVKPFDFAIDSAANGSKSYPCIYPHPAYIADNGIDQIAAIYPTAISAAAVSTNYTFAVDDPYDNGDNINPETNGYYFAASVPSSTIDDPREVDDFWLDADAALGAKLVAEVTARTGADPSAPGGILAGVEAKLDALLTGEGNYYFCNLLATNIHISTDGYWDDGIDDYWYADTYQLSNVRPSGYGYWLYDITAVKLNPTNYQYEAITPQPDYVRHLWSFSYGTEFATNAPSSFTSAAARGRLSGLEAVKWNFKAMHDARSTQSSAPLRVLPGGAPAADSLTTTNPTP